MVRVAAALLLFSTVLLDAAVPLRAQTAPPRIRLNSCVVRAGGVGTLNSIAADMRVRFVNESSETLKTIVWRANTPAGTVDFTDSGTFSPGVSIYRVANYRGAAFSHRVFELIAPAFTVMGPGVCSVIETVSGSGEVWKAPGVAPPALDLAPAPSEFSLPVPASFDNPLHDPVGIISCRFSMFFGRAYGYVRFRNLSSRTINSITFRAFFGEGGIDFVNRGVFSPGAVVRAGDMRRRDLPPNVYQEYETRDSPTSCVAVSARYSDGTVWEHPTVGPTEPPFPVGVP